MPKFHIDRQRLLASAGALEAAPLWDSGVGLVLTTIRHFRDHGIRIKPNQEGVTYYKMPGEESVDVGTC